MSGNNLIVSNTGIESGTNFSVGDTLRLLDDHDAVAGDATVTGVVALPTYQNSRKSARTTVRDFTAGPYYQSLLTAPWPRPSTTWRQIPPQAAPALRCATTPSTTTESAA